MPATSTVQNPAPVRPYPRFAAGLLAMLTACGASDHLATQAHSPSLAFNVPALRGQSIDQVRTALGAPENADDEPSPELLAAGQTQWAKSFAHDTVQLVVTYNAATRQVYNFVLCTPHGRTADCGPLLQLANVHGSAPGFRVEPVPAPGAPGRFTGVRFWPL